MKHKLILLLRYIPAIDLYFKRKEEEAAALKHQALINATLAHLNASTGKISHHPSGLTASPWWMKNAALIKQRAEQPAHTTQE